MLAFTVKCVIKRASDHCGAKTIRITFEDYNNKQYKFNISRKGITMEVISQDNSYSIEVDNIEMLKIPSTLKPLYMEEESLGPDFSTVIDYRKLTFVYEAHLFIALFRLMREKVYFTLVHQGKYIDCYGFGGKVYYIEETEDEILMQVSDLFKLNRTMEGYSIVNVNPLPLRASYPAFVARVSNIAKEKGKTFRSNKEYAQSV